MNTEDQIKYRLLFQQINQSYHIYDPYKKRNILNYCGDLTNRVLTTSITSRRVRRISNYTRRQNQLQNNEEVNCLRLKKMLKNLETLPSPDKNITKNQQQHINRKQNQVQQNQQNISKILQMPSQNTIQSENMERQAKYISKFQLKQKLICGPSRLFSQNSQRITKTRQASLTNQLKSTNLNCIRVRQLIKKKFNQKQSIKLNHRKQSLTGKQNIETLVMKGKSIRELRELSNQKNGFTKFTNIIY